jgi:hypothetical protein
MDGPFCLIPLKLPCQALCLVLREDQRREKQGERTTRASQKRRVDLGSLGRVGCCRDRDEGFQLEGRALAQACEQTM